MTPVSAIIAETFSLIVIPNLGQVSDGRCRTELFQEFVAPSLFGLHHFRNFRLGIIEIAEDDTTRRAAGSAGGLSIAILEYTLFDSSLLFGVLNAVNAESTFLHDPAGPYGHVRIERQVQRLLDFLR